MHILTNKIHCLKKNRKKKKQQQQQKTKKDDFCSFLMLNLRINIDTNNYFFFVEILIPLYFLEAYESQNLKEALHP